MSEPHGQITTEVPAPGGAGTVVAISSGRNVEQGARSMLILATGLFRLDVIPFEDTVQTILRNLSPAREAVLRYAEVGGDSVVLGGGPASPTGRFGGDVVLRDGGEERPVARLLVGSVCHLDRGVTSFTAQATLL